MYTLNIEKKTEKKKTQVFFCVVVCILSPKKYEIHAQNIDI